MKRKLNILFIVGSFPTISQTFIVNQIIYLLNQGHTVKILAKKRTNSPIQNQIEEYGLMQKVEYINISKSYLERFKTVFLSLFTSEKPGKWELLKTLNPLLYRREALNLLAFFKVSWTLKFRDNFDIVHAHFAYNSDLFFRARKVGFFKYSSLITTFHGFDMTPSDLNKNKSRYKILFDSQTVITTNNEYGKSLVQKIRPNYKNIYLIPVSLDTNLFFPAPGKRKPEDKIHIVFCGRLIYWKGPHLFVEIANQIINHRNIQNVQFEIIGDGEERLIIENLIEKYNLKNFVNLRGALKQNEVKEILVKSHIFISPGLTDKNGRAETQGLVIQEAQAMELPVIVSDAGGMKYGVKDQETGYVLPKGDVKSFCDKVECLIKNPIIRYNMGEKARQYIVEDFDIRPLGMKLEELYFKHL